MTSECISSHTHILQALSQTEFTQQKSEQETNSNSLNYMKYNAVCLDILPERDIRQFKLVRNEEDFTHRDRLALTNINATKSYAALIWSQQTGHHI